MRTPLLIALLSVTGSLAHAGTLLIENTPATNIAGTIYTFSMLAEQGETFRGFDFTYEGGINQQLAAGMPTPFTDFDVFLPEGGAEDSKFLFASGDVLAIDVEESSSSLVGAISGLANAGLPNPTPLARIVIPSHVCHGSYRLAVDLGGSEAQIFTGAYLCPEPSTCLLSGLALIGLATRRVG